MKKTIFSKQNERDVIACIGSNTGLIPGERDFGIAMGYDLSVKILYDQIVKNHANEDLLIYPIFYNARLALEVLLKHLLGYELFLETFTKRIVEAWNVPITHSLKELYDLLLQKAVSFDERLKEYIDGNANNLTKIDIFFFDEKSDAFRYTFSTDGKIILEGKNVVDVTMLVEIYSTIYSILNEMDALYNCLYEEYKTGSYTKHLSRRQLEEIARKLPPKEYWTKGVFSEKKVDIIKEYSISSREFSNALNIIKKIPYLSVIINQEIIIHDFSDSFYDGFEELKTMASFHYVKGRKSINQICNSVNKDAEDFNESYNQLQVICKRIDDLDKILFLTYKAIGVYNFYYEDFHKIYDGIKNAPSRFLSDKFNASLATLFDGRFLHGLELCGQKTIIKKLGL